MKKKGKAYLCAALLFCAVFCCMGCAGQKEHNNDFLITEKEKEQTQYITATATTGDVIKTEQIRCTYLQVNDQEVGFCVSGKKIMRVYVDVGDSVVKGQLLAELSDDRIEEKIAGLEYRIGRNRMLLEDSELNENYEISAKWLQFIYHSDQSEEEKEALEESIRQLQQKYRYLREDYQDAINLDETELENLHREAEVSRLYAGMSGVISWIKDGLEGSTSSRNETVMKIVDSSECLFVVEGTEYADLFEKNTPVEMRISSGHGAGQYELLPYRMERWKDRLTFFLPEEYDSSVIEIGTSGTITVATDRRTQVLTVPSEAVHMTEDAAYVYVIGEGNLREIRWIDIGLYGDETVEVTSGIEKGEMVIVR